MDEHFRKRGLWIGLGALAIIFLCVMMCGMGSMAMMGMSRGAAYVAPPAVEDGAAPPPAAYGYGPHGWGSPMSHGPFGFIGLLVSGFFKLVVFGLLLLIVIKLVMRLFFGRRMCGPKHWGKPPKGDPGEWGPPWHAWHRHHRHRGPRRGPAGPPPAQNREDAPAETNGGDAAEQSGEWYDSQQEGEPDQDHAAA